MKVLSLDRHHMPWQAATSQPSTSIIQKLQGTWQALLRFMTESTNEPHIWMSQDHTGELQWNASDPLTGRQLTHATEAEVLSWLEQRYYVS